MIFKFFVTTISLMAKNRGGAPRKSPDKSKSALIQLRVSAAEKEAFQMASEADGKKLSEWMRDRLRAVSRKELEELGQSAPFVVARKPAGQ